MNVLEFDSSDTKSKLYFYNLFVVIHFISMFTEKSTLDVRFLGDFRQFIVTGCW